METWEGMAGRMKSSQGRQEVWLSLHVKGKHTQLKVEEHNKLVNCDVENYRM